MIHLPQSQATEELANVPKPAAPERKVFSSGVGKYINPAVKKEARKAEVVEEGQAGRSQPKKKKTNSYAFSDFSSW